jgi:GT2 family glycosyltransferase
MDQQTALLEASLFVHIVTYNNEGDIAACLESVIAQQGFCSNGSFSIQVTDNASTDKTVEIVERYRNRVDLVVNRANVGFCGGHNKGVQRFLETDAQYFLALNPDIILEAHALHIMLQRFSLCQAANPRLGLVTMKLLRFSDKKERIIDSTGMIFKRSFRHLDRGAGERDQGQYDDEEIVPGGTGACLGLTRECLTSLLLPPEIDDSLTSVYPALNQKGELRPQLFDEAFFAYREDADLALRSRLFGWRCLYVPSAVAFHRRRVTPERRLQLAPSINSWSVRNRFLLQINNYAPGLWPGVWWRGIVLRNLLVIFTVLLVERTSLGAFRDLWILRRRALRNRNFILTRYRELCGPCVENVFL